MELAREMFKLGKLIIKKGMYSNSIWIMFGTKELFTYTDKLHIICVLGRRFNLKN